MIEENWITERPEPKSFVLDRYIPRHAVTMINGAGGVGKSITTLTMALHVAAGLPYLGCATENLEGCQVVYITLEDDAEILRHRFYLAVQNLMRQSPLARGRVLKNFRYIDRYGMPTHVVETLSGGEIRVTDLVDKFAALCEDADLIIVDTLVRSHSVNENDNSAMATVLTAFERLAKLTDSGVAVLHHVGKGRVKAGDGYSSRGASAISDNTRSGMLLAHATEDDVKYMTNVEPQWVHEQRLVCVSHTKHNYSPKEPPKWLLFIDASVEEFSPIYGSVLDKNYAERLAELRLWLDELHPEASFCKQQLRDAVDDIRSDGATVGYKQYNKVVDRALERGDLAVDGHRAADNPSGVYYCFPESQ